MNPYWIEQEMWRRVEEAQREADAYRLAQVARGDRPGRFSLNLSSLKCRARAILVGLGFTVERCPVPAFQSARG